MEKIHDGIHEAGICDKLGLNFGLHERRGHRGPICSRLRPWSCGTG